MSHPGIARQNRPVSPHLQVYSLPLAALLSISHRITGVVLSLGLLITAAVPSIAVWIPESFNEVQPVLNSMPAKVGLWLWVFAIYFHASHGVRHLIWDSLHGLDRRQVMTHNLIEIGVSIVMTLGTFLLLAGQSLTGLSTL